MGIPTKTDKPVVAKAGDRLATKVDPDDRLFAMFLAHCVQGLLAGNLNMDEGALGAAEYYESEELLDRALWYAEEMVEAVKNRREVDRFESKVKEAE